MDIKALFVSLIVAFSAGWFSYHVSIPPPSYFNIFSSSSSRVDSLPYNDIEKLLSNHSNEFDKEEIVTVVPNLIHSAIGYGLANSIIIETDKSLIIVDTLESLPNAHKLRNNLYKLIPNKNISAIIYTHYHPDHTLGTKAFIDNENKPPKIIAHPKTLHNLERIFSITSSITHIRGNRQFGSTLSESKIDSVRNKFLNSGIGPKLLVGENYPQSLVYPNVFLNESITNMTIDNLNFIFYHAPGETDDQLLIHLPQHRVLLPADNIYKTFPNLYAIRGTVSRDVKGWVKSLDLMRSIKPRPLYLVPSHTRPIIGEDKIYNTLTIYRDAIAFVHDQTVRGINLDKTPEDIIAYINTNLPEIFYNEEYLHEKYGTIEWSIKAIFGHYLGWFSGDPIDLYPLSNSIRGEKLLELLNDYKLSSFQLNSEEFILNYAQNLLNNNSHYKSDCQYSLELSTWLLKYYKNLNKDKYKNIINLAKNIRIQSMKCLSKHTLSSSGRNYYLTVAFEEEYNHKIIPSKEEKILVFTYVPIEQIFNMLPVRIKLEALPLIAKDNIDPKIVYFIFDDSCKIFKSEIRMKHKVIEVSKINTNCDDINLLKTKNITYDNYFNLNTKDYLYELFNNSWMIMLTNEYTYRGLLAETINGMIAYASGNIKVLKGSIFELMKFPDYFERD